MRRTYIFLFILVVFSAFAVGCRSGEAEFETGNNGISETETPYVLYEESGENVTYLREDHPEVSRVRSFITEFVTVMNTMDYKAIDKDKALPFLTQSMQEFTVEQKTWEILFDNLKKVEVVSEAKDVTIELAHFEHDFSAVYILYTSTINILEANEEKLAETSMSLGENRERAALHLILENGSWRISGFGKLE